MITELKISLDSDINNKPFVLEHKALTNDINLSLGADAVVEMDTKLLIELKNTIDSFLGIMKEVGRI